MNALRGLWDDLVDRRLWPFAAALLIALVAVPVVLHRSGAKSSEPTPVATLEPVSADQPSAPVVTLATSQQRGAIPGSVKNPFRPQHVPRAPLAPAVSPASQGTAPASSGTGGAAASKPASSPGQGSTPGPVASPAPAVKHRHPTKRRLETVVLVRFGRFGYGLGQRVVAPLVALPPKASPFLVYLGRAKDGHSAVFQLADDAVPDGNGTCVPSPSLCREYKMRAGDHADFTVGRLGHMHYRYRLLVDGFGRR